MLSLYAKGLTGKFSHFAEIYGARLFRETLSRITGTVVDEMAGWSARPLKWMSAVVFIDAVRIKITDG